MPSRVMPWMAAHPPSEPGIYLLTSSRFSAEGEIEVKAGKARDIADRFKNHAHEVSYRDSTRLRDGGLCRLIGVRIVKNVKLHRAVERELLNALREVGRLAIGPDGWFSTREWFWVMPEDLVSVIRGH